MELRYINEDEKCYGITGMAIGMVVWNAEDVLASVSLDAPVDEVVEFTNEYYFNGNPRLSAKVAWNHILEHYQVSMGMMIGNVLCRSYVLHESSLDNKIKDELIKYLDEEGRETCSLDSDEVRRLFDKSFSYLNKVFNHSGVQSIAHDFARVLKNRRRMSRGEVIEQLQALHQL